MAKQETPNLVMLRDVARRGRLPRDHGFRYRHHGVSHRSSGRPVK